MQSKRNKTVSLAGFIASIITIFAFTTGIYSIPSLLSNGSSQPLVEVGRPTLSYGALIISQAIFFFAYFTATRFWYDKVVKGILHLYDGFADFICLVIFVLLGLGLSFLFAEAFWGSIKNWDVKNGFSLPIIFLFLSFVGHLLVAKCAVEWD